MRGNVAEGGWDDPIWDLPADEVDRILSAREHPDTVGKGDVDALELWSARRAGELQELLPEATRGQVTMAAGVAENPAGERTKLIATSEPRGYLRKEVREAIEPDETVVRGRAGVHAEVDIIAWADGNGHRALNVGAGRPICGDCGRRLDDAEVPSVTPRKKEP